MEIYFRQKKDAKTVSDQRELVARYGSDARHIMNRMSELQAAADLSQVNKLPPARCHSLTGDREGQFAVCAGTKVRIVFEPTADEVPRLTDGGVDLSRVTAITIIEVVDYHG